MQLLMYLSFNQKMLTSILLCYTYAAPGLCVGFSSHEYFFTQFIFTLCQFHFYWVPFHCYIWPRESGQRDFITNSFDSLNLVLAPCFQTLSVTSCTTQLNFFFVLLGFSFTCFSWIVKFFFYILTVWANEAVVSCLSVGLIILIHGILLNCAYIVWFVFLYVYFLPSYTPMFSVTWVVENVRWQCVWHKRTNTVEGCAFLQTLSDIGCVHIVACK